MKIVFLDRDTLSPQIQLRTPAFEHQLVSYGNTPASAVRARIADADIVITNKVRVDADSLSGANWLKLIAVAATGTDNIDLDACAARGIIVSNVRHYATRSVPEHTFALIFALRRSLCAYRDSVRAGRWQASGQFCYFDHPIHDLAGSTLGVVGTGALGTAVARIGRALDMRVLMASSRSRGAATNDRVSLDVLLAESDIITLHCPLTPATRHLIGAREMARMRKRPLLVNTARGGLIDEAAVGPALDTGHIAGAAFDVTASEPPTADHPFMALVERPDFILTPHVAWASSEAMQALADQLIDNVEAFALGAPVNVVT
ncbi:MAG: D-2-hydroxyacid dehydrogenase [Burkholderiales bacterium]|nr:D-2-hydroxyacid dehydrogenase [Burkholderiales bacterium]